MMTSALKSLPCPSLLAVRARDKPLLKLDNKLNGRMENGKLSFIFKLYGYAKGKQHSRYLGPYCSYKENEVL
jgi:hypothetical protein